MQFAEPFGSRERLDAAGWPEDQIEKLGQGVGVAIEHHGAIGQQHLADIGIRKPGDAVKELLARLLEGVATGTEQQIGQTNAHRLIQVGGAVDNQLGVADHTRRELRRGAHGRVVHRQHIDGEGLRGRQAALSGCPIAHRIGEGAGAIGIRSRPELQPLHLHQAQLLSCRHRHKSIVGIGIQQSDLSKRTIRERRDREGQRLGGLIGYRDLAQLIRSRIRLSTGGPGQIGQAQRRDRRILNEIESLGAIIESPRCIIHRIDREAVGGGQAAAVAIDHVVGEGYRAIGMGLGREGPLASGVYSQAAIAAAHAHVLHTQLIALIRITEALQQLGGGERAGLILRGIGQDGLGAGELRCCVDPHQSGRPACRCGLSGHCRDRNGHPVVGVLVATGAALAPIAQLQCQFIAT